MPDHYTKLNAGSSYQWTSFSLAGLIGEIGL